MTLAVQWDIKHQLFTFDPWGEFVCSYALLTGTKLCQSVNHELGCESNYLSQRKVNM